MRSHQEQRDALLREREARAAAYLAAVEARDAIAPFASAPDALEFDRRELARAESRIGLAEYAMRQWKDPMPDIAAQPSTESNSSSVASEPSWSVRGPDAADTAAEAVAARILACDEPGAAAPPAATELDAIARRIADA